MPSFHTKGKKQLTMANRKTAANTYINRLAIIFALFLGLCIGEGNQIKTDHSQGIKSRKCETNFSLTKFEVPSFLFTYNLTLVYTDRRALIPYFSKLVGFLTFTVPKSTPDFDNII